jgi:hypothetical protein
MTSNRRSALARQAGASVVPFAARVGRDRQAAFAATAQRPHRG